jgi:hypothetical protein
MTNETRMHGAGVIVHRNNEGHVGFSRVGDYLPKRTWPIAAAGVDGSLMRLTDDEFDYGMLEESLEELDASLMVEGAECTFAEAMNDLGEAGKIAIFLDTTMMHQPENQRIAAEVIAYSLGRRQIEVLYFGSKKFSPELTPFCNHGAADADAVSAYVDSLAEAPSRVVLVTDGFGNFAQPENEERWFWAQLPGARAWMNCTMSYRAIVATTEETDNGE